MTDTEISSETSPTEAALIAIAKNAVALLNDAKLLFEHGRFPRAAALAVLAGEEAGKFLLLKFEPAWRVKFKRHPEKLTVGAAFHQEEAAGSVATSTGGMCDTYRAAPDNPDYAEWVQRARAFALIKEAGLYVNLDNLGRVTSDPPKHVGRDRAAECLAYAQTEVQRLYVAKVVQRSLSSLTDLPA